MTKKVELVRSEFAATIAEQNERMATRLHDSNKDNQELVKRLQRIEDLIEHQSDDADTTLSMILGIVRENI